MSRAMTATAASPPTASPPRWASETATSSGPPSARHQTVVCSPDASPAAAFELRDRLVAQVEGHHRQNEADGLRLGVSEHAVRGRAPAADAALRIDFAHGGLQHKPPGSILDRLLNIGGHHART